MHSDTAGQDRILTKLLLGAVVIFVELEVVATGHEEILLGMQGGRVDGRWGIHSLNQVKAV